MIFQTLEAGCLSAAALAKAEALKTGAAGSKGWNFLETLKNSLVCGIVALWCVTGVWNVCYRGRSYRFILELSKIL